MSYGKLVNLAVKTLKGKIQKILGILRCARHAELETLLARRR